MYKALVSFCGAVSMAKNEIGEIKDRKLIKDLLNAGYIEEIKPASKSAPKAKK